MLTRRRFLLHTGVAGAALATSRFDLLALQEDLWTTASAIVARIKPPEFPSHEVDVTAHGAKPDGTTDCTAAFREAIEACGKAGGGRVVVPRGRFLTGAIRLRSNVNLHLADGATIAFDPDPSKYLPLVLTRFEGTELMNYSPFIYAFDERNVAITGKGTLDGQADQQHWWDWRTGQADARNRLRPLEVAQILGVLPEILAEFGLDQSRSDGINPNTVRSELVGPAPRKHDEPGLGKAVE